MYTRWIRNWCWLGVMGALAVLVSNCSSDAKVTLHPEGKDAKTVAIISAYSTGKLSLVAAGDMDLQAVQASLLQALADGISTQTRFKVKPLDETFESAAYKKYVSEMNGLIEQNAPWKALRDLGTTYKKTPYMGVLLWDECKKPVFGTCDDNNRIRGLQLGMIKQIANELNVDAVLVVSFAFDIQPDKASAKLGAGLANTEVSIYPYIRTPDGRQVMTYDPFKPGVFTDTCLFYVLCVNPSPHPGLSTKRLPMAAGFVKQDKGAEAALMEGIRPAVADLVALMKAAETKKK